MNEDYYGSYRDEPKVKEVKKPKKEKKKISKFKLNITFNKKIFFIVLCSIIGIGLIIGIILFIQNINKNREIKFKINNIELNIGDNKNFNELLNYKNKNYQILWNSSNLSILNINQDGIGNALQKGESTITISYIDNKNLTHTSECLVKVISNIPESNIDIQVLSNGSNNWNNKDVTLKISATGNIEIKELKYTIDCQNNCSYTKISNPGSIKITSNGSHTVNIIATDINNYQKEKQVIVKIDKQSPTYTLKINGSGYKANIYDNTGTVKVCYTCKDNLSGCVNSSKCENITTNKSNYYVTIKDNAGNQVKSYSFNIIIDKVKPTCSLSVVNGTDIKATYSDTGGSNLYYYGFNSNYLGSNELSRTIKEDGQYTYYVKDNAGNTNTCSIKVKKVGNVYNVVS